MHDNSIEQSQTKREKRATFTYERENDFRVASRSIAHCPAKMEELSKYEFCVCTRLALGIYIILCLV